MDWLQALKSYQNYLRIERGLSENTVINYGLDIKKLIRWLNKHQITSSPIAITDKEIQEFVYQIAKEVTPRSQSRIISGLKGFFNYLLFEELRKDHFELIETPKIKQLPDTLPTGNDRLLPPLTVIPQKESAPSHTKRYTAVDYGIGIVN